MESNTRMTLRCFECEIALTTESISLENITLYNYNYMLASFLTLDLRTHITKPVCEELILQSTKTKTFHHLGKNTKKTRNPLSGIELH